MDDTVKQHHESLANPHILPALPTELWLNIFDHVVTDDTHIFDQTLRCRRQRTRDLQKLQYVCKSWRDMVNPLVYRHMALNGNGDHPEIKSSCILVAGDVTALARLLDCPTDSGSPTASWVRSFWIERDDCGHDTRPSLSSLQEVLVGLISRMTNLSELCCRVTLYGPQIASIVHSHGSRLTKLSVDLGGFIDVSESLPLLKHFTALTDLQLVVHSSYPLEIEPLDLPNLRSLQIVTAYATDELLACLTQWTMPVLSAFACLMPPASYRIGAVRPGGSVLIAFMAKHGSGLKTVLFDDTYPTLTVFPYTPSLDIYKTFDMTHVLEGLPLSVTQISFCQFGENLGYQVQILRRLHQTLQSLPPEKNLHTIRVVSKDEDLGGWPFLWRDVLQGADTRRVNTWKEFNHHAKGLLELGVLILDEQNVALTDVLEEMESPQHSNRTELMESVIDTLLASEE